MFSDHIVGSIIGGFGGTAGAILVALIFVLRYLNSRDMRNKESFENLAEVYTGMVRDIVSSHEKNIERIIMSSEHSIERIVYSGGIHRQDCDD